MPTHIYQPRRFPVTAWDRVLVHPLETAVGMLAGICGLVNLFSLVIPSFTPSPALENMWWPVVLAEGIFLAVGGALVFAGLQWVGDDVSTGWSLERFGWLLVAGGFITYGITVIVEYPDSLFSWGIPVVLGAASLLRCWVVLLIERAMRITIAEVKGQP